jgi:hypothetical protein
MQSSEYDSKGMKEGYTTSETRVLHSTLGYPQKIIITENAPEVIGLMKTVVGWY